MKQPPPQIGDYVVTTYSTMFPRVRCVDVDDTISQIKDGFEVAGRLVQYNTDRLGLLVSKRASQRLAIERLYYPAAPLRRLTLAEYLTLRQMGEIDDDDES